MIVDPDWLLWPSLFTDAECETFVAAAKQIGDIAGDMTWDHTKKIPEVRSSRLRWIYRSVAVDLSWAFIKADQAFADGSQAFQAPIDNFDAFQFTEYHASRRGHYDWHRDDFPAQALAYDRRLSMCMQLSDPDGYGGGWLELRVKNAPPAELLRRRGAAIIFRSSTEHRVSATVVGTRYSAVSWALGCA